MNASEVAPVVAEVIGVTVAVTTCLGFLAIIIVAPERFMRLAVRSYMLWRTPAERELICRRSDRAAYYYLGTTGDRHRDATLSRFDRAYSRGVGIATVIGFVGIFAFAIIHGLAT